MSKSEPPVVNRLTQGTPGFPVAQSDQTSWPQHEPTVLGKRGMLASRTAILGLLFFVTAALGLPFLWMSPAFSTSEKWIWSIVILIYTLVLILLTSLVLWWSWSQISRSFA